MNKMKCKKSLITALATITLVPSLMILDTRHDAKAVGNSYYNGMEEHNASAAYHKAKKVDSSQKKLNDYCCTFFLLNTYCLVQIIFKNIIALNFLSKPED